MITQDQPNTRQLEGDPRAARIAVSAVFFLLGGQLAVWAVSVPLIRLKFGLDEAELGRLLLCFGFGAVLAVPFSSALLKRYPHSSVTRICGLVGLFSFMLLGFIPSVVLLAFLMVFCSLFLATTDVAMNANAVDVEELAQRPMMSSFHGWFSAGGLFGLVLGPLAAKVGLAAMVLAGAGLLFAAFVVVQRNLLDAPVQVVDAVPSQGGMFRNFSFVLLALALANMVSYSLEGAVIDWSGVHAEKVLNAEPYFYGIGFAAFSVTMAIIRFSGDYMRSVFGNRKVLVASCLLGAAGYFIVASSSTVWQATGGYALLGLGMANLVPIFFVMAARVPGVTAGTGIALVAGMGYVGFLTVPPIIGFIARGVGLPAVFYGLSFILLMTVLVVFIFPKKQSE